MCIRDSGVESAWPDLAAGKVVFLSEKPRSATQATIHIVARSDGSTLDRVVLPARVFATGLQPDELPGALVSTATLGKLGLTRGPSDAVPSDRYLIRLAHPVSTDDLAKAGSIASAYPDTHSFDSLPPDRGQDLFRLLMIAFAVVFALSVTGIAVALGEAESRPEPVSYTHLRAHETVL